MCTFSFEPIDVDNLSEALDCEDAEISKTPRSYSKRAEVKAQQKEVYFDLINVQSARTIATSEEVVSVLVMGN